MFDQFFPHVKRALAQLSVDDAARILLSLVADHPMRRELAARFLDWEESLHDTEVGVLGGSGNSVPRQEADELLKSFVRSVISEVWKP